MILIDYPHSKSTHNLKSQFESCILIGGKVEISPKDSTVGVKAKLGKNLFNLPQVTNKC
jgi:hypothetical protein